MNFLTGLQASPKTPSEAEPKRVETIVDTEEKFNVYITKGAWDLLKMEPVLRKLNGMLGLEITRSHTNIWNIDRPNFIDHHCLFCGRPLSKKAMKYCGVACSNAYRAHGKTTPLLKVNTGPIKRSLTELEIPITPTRTPKPPIVSAQPIANKSVVETPKKLKEEDTPTRKKRRTFISSKK